MAAMVMKSWTRAMSKQTGGDDGWQHHADAARRHRISGSPFTGGGLPGPWASTIYGNYNGWTPNFTAPNSPITLTMRCVHRELSAWFADRRSDFAIRPLRRRRPADA